MLVCIPHVEIMVLDYIHIILVLLGYSNGELDWYAICPCKTKTVLTTEKRMSTYEKFMKKEVLALIKPNWL